MNRRTAAFDSFLYYNKKISVCQQKKPALSGRLLVKAYASNNYFLPFLAAGFLAAAFFAGAFLAPDLAAFPALAALITA